MRHSTFLEVNLSLLQENIQSIKNICSNSIIAMVKGNAYGHGMGRVALTLRDDCGISEFGVASLGEALALQSELKSNKSQIYIFSDTEILNPDCQKYYLDHPHFIPVLATSNDVSHALKHYESLPIALKMNTGMNRLGLSLSDLEPFMLELKNRSVAHLFTHLGNSFFPLKANDRNHQQMQNFYQAKEMLKAGGVTLKSSSVACSGAIEQSFALGETHIRPGLMMYGPYSVSAESWKGKNISRFVTKIIKKFFLKKDDLIGYGGMPVTDDCCVLILPIGYADLSIFNVHGAKIILNGITAEVFGRVNMDMMAIKINLEYESKFKEGMSLEIWNHDNRVISDLASEMKTIPYQLLCGLTTRIPRIYK